MPKKMNHACFLFVLFVLQIVFGKIVKKYLAAGILLFVFAGLMFGNAYAAIPLEERNALIDLYNSTGGANWKNNTNWLGEPGTECTWYGITCDAENTHIIMIYLQDNRLTGTVPVSLGSMGSLQALHLENNQLTGGIPKELGNLTSLEHLWLGWNPFGGVIPVELSNLSNLQSLYLLYFCTF